MTKQRPIKIRNENPGQHYPPLRSAEPQPATQAQRDELTLTAGQPVPESLEWSRGGVSCVSTATRRAVIIDPERRAYLTEIAALMDARKDRIGEHAAQHALPWALNSLGPVPEHPLDRLDWQRRAASIGAWRERGWPVFPCMHSRKSPTWPSPPAHPDPTS